MLDEAICPSRLCRCGSPDAEARTYIFQRTCRDIIESVVGFFSGFASPKIEIGLIPNLEIPAGYLVDPVSFDKVMGEFSNELVPLARVAGWGDIGMVPEGMGNVSLRHFLGHETQFDKWTDPNVEQAIIDKV